MSTASTSGRQCLGLVNDFPPDQQIVRGGFEQDALPARRQYYSMPAHVFTLDQPGEDGRGSRYPLVAQQVTQTGEAAVVTQQIAGICVLSGEDPITETLTADRLMSCRVGSCCTGPRVTRVR